jgi:hypothetical protein
VSDLKKGVGHERNQRHRPRQIFSGKLKEWKRLTEQAMEIVRTKDKGTLQYEIFSNADESEACGAR